MRPDAPSGTPRRVATYILLLRGINVSGKRKVPMADLREMAEGLGLTNVRTYIQSGNVVVEAAASRRSGLSAEFSAAIAERFGHDDVPVTLRTPKELAAVVARNPYCGDAADRDEDPKRVAVCFLNRKPTAKAVAALDAFDARGDESWVDGREVFLFCPSTFAKTKLTNDRIERLLGVGATTRNWRTVNKLVELSAK